MKALVGQCEAAGVRAAYDSQALGLIVGTNGEITGVRVRQSDRTVDIRARRGVIIATGNFGCNSDMVLKYAPSMKGNSYAIGIPYNDGAGIELGMSVGAAVQSMDGFNATASFYPPGQLIKGILVNKHGKRFVAEDSYHGRTGQYIRTQPEGIAYLILDAETFAYPENVMFGHRLVDGWETIAEMEAGLKLPPGSLQCTLNEYNRDAAVGEDSRFFKYPEWLKPLTAAPYAAFDVSFNRSTYFFHSLGGLKVTARAEVIGENGERIPGLYAAGGCASTIVQDAEGYASGLSLGTGSFFGRVAGKIAAQQ